MDIKGPRIRISPIKLENVYEMRKWGYHYNPLLGDYNFPKMNDREIKLWYKYKTSGWCNKYFAVFNEEDTFIGYLGIKEIKQIRKESTLGIVFDPNYIDKGYGTETLYTFLKYYFNDLGMRKMYLEVAEFNKRAYRLYSNMGFKQVGYYLDIFFNQKLDFTNPYYLKEKSSFVIDDKKIYNYIYKMKLEKHDFEQVTIHRS